MKNFLLSFFLLAFASSAFAQTTLAPEIQKAFYQACVQNNPELWISNIKTLETDYQSSQDLDLLYEITNAYYGLAGTYIGNKMPEKAEETINKTLDNIALLIKEKKDSPEVHALQAGIYGMQMSFSPMSGMTLGPKATKHLNKSLKLDADNPKGNYQMGGSYYYTPAMFGGSTKKAIEYYKKAVEAFEAKGELTNNWEYLTAITWLGIAYKEYEDLEKAKVTFEKALNFEPDHNWVKHYLLPQVSKS